MTLTDIPPSVIEALENGVPAVRAFREATGETAEAFSENARIDFARLRELKAGQTPTQDEVSMLAAGLGVSVDDLNSALE